MSTGELLDFDAREMAHALGAVIVGIALFLVVALLIPVVVLSGLFHPGLSLPVPSIPLPALLTGQTTGATSGAPPSASGPASGIVELARRYLGVRYLFGGTDPAVGLDCSGLTQLVYRQLGMALPRTAQQQFAATARITRDQLQPGDLVFFAHTYADPNDWVTHVGIYIGDGQQINAPTDGQVVSIQPVFSGFWGTHFIGGGRMPSRQSAA